MKNFLVSSFFGFILLYSFDEYFDKKIPVVDYLPKTHGIILNPLDVILGDKKLDDGSIRKDNFQDILRLKASFLKDSSALYRVQQLKKDLFLLTRKKFYYNNRNYSLVIKTKENRIIVCYPVKDFLIKGALLSEDKMYWIGDDYDEIAKPWRSTYTVKVSCMDLDLHEQWVVSSKSGRGYFFYGTDLKLKNNILVAGIAVQNQGGSTMCVDYFDLSLSKKGKVLHSVFLGTDACRGKNTELEEINKLFE